VAIMTDDQLILSEAYGLARDDQVSRLTPKHLFSMGSQAKMFTTAALLQLVEQQKIQLDDQLVAHLPEFNTHPDPQFGHITLRHLLSHTSGLVREGATADYWQGMIPFPTAPQLKRMIMEAQIVHKPGAHMKYSNLGFAILGQLIEKVSAQSYRHYLDAHLFKPLQLTHTMIGSPSAQSSQAATGYALAFDRQRQELPKLHHAKAFNAVTGIWSTPTDMCRFLAAYLGNSSLLKSHTQKEAMHTQALVKKGLDEGTEYGLGLEILDSSAGPLMGHSGHALGHQSATFFSPDLHIAVSVAANCKDAQARTIVQGIFEALSFFATHATQPVPANLAKFNVRAVNQFSTVEILATHERIVAIDCTDWLPFSWADELQVRSPTELHITTPGSIFTEGETVHYNFKNGKCTSLIYAGITLMPA